MTMGGVLSATSRSNIDHDDEDIWNAQHDILTAKLGFFRNWRTEDVEVVLDRFRTRIRPSDDSSDSMPGEASATRGGHADGQIDLAEVQLEWHELFRAVLDAEEGREHSTREKRQWHVAARGYAMVKHGALATVQHNLSSFEEVDAGASIPGYTDDEASDEEVDQARGMFDDGSSGRAPGNEPTACRATRNLGGAILQHDTGVTFGCDAAVVSPVFFGYMSTTEADVDAENAKERASLDREEARVIEKQRVGRNLELAREREAASKRREARERTVVAMEAEFERGRQKRITDLQTAKKVMAAEEYRPVLKQW
ncbi:unnamed protein product, partial [Ectocarpus sp. 13 AM-2016]